MNKLFKILSSTVLGIALAVGVGVAQGSKYVEVNAANPVITLENIGANAAGSSVTSVTTTDITAKGTTDKYTLNYFQGKKQGSAILLTKSTGAFISNKTPIPGSIISTTVYINSGASGKTTYHCAFSTTECTSEYTTGSTAVNITGGNSHTYSCSVSNAKYFCIALGNANNGQVLKIEIEYSGKCKTPKDIAYNSSNQTVTWTGDSNASSYKFSSDNGSTYTNVGKNLYADVSSLESGVTYDCKIIAVGDGTSFADSDAASFSFTKTNAPVYTSVTVNGGSIQGTEKTKAYIQCNAVASGTDVPVAPVFTWSITETDTFGTSVVVENKANIDNTGKVTFLDNCTVYVWALAPDGTTHNSTGYQAVASGLLDPKGSINNPFTVTEAKAKIDAGAGTETWYIKGIVSEVTSFSSTYGSITFWISDDGSHTTSHTNEFQLFGCLDINSEQFKSKDDIAVADYVEVGGVMKKYSGTYEMDKNCFLTVHSQKTLSSIELVVKSGTYYVGQTIKNTDLTVTAHYSDESSLEITDGYQIYVNDVEDGVLVVGSNSVKVIFSSLTSNIVNVTGTNVPATSITISGSSTLEVGRSSIFTSIVEPSTCTETVVWSSSNTDVATISDGLLTGVSAGSTEVTATVSGITSNSIEVTVTTVPTTLISDIVTSAILAATNTTYKDFSGVKVPDGTSALYAGNSAKTSSNAIQLRSSNSAGIVSTNSGGIVSKVTVAWDGTTVKGRKVDIYGSNSAYSNAGDLYNASTAGNLIGTLTYDTSTTSTELSILTNYKYIGLRASDGAVYLTSVTIDWMPGLADEFAVSFLELLECDPTGLNAPSRNDWDDLGSMFDDLSAGDKTNYLNTVASESGIKIERCVAKYDYILSKYGTDTEHGGYSNFMNRSITPASSASILSSMNTDNNIAIIVVISVVSLTALGGYFFIRRRKETH